jgi:phosphate:Na+ symporter
MPFPSDASHLLVLIAGAAALLLWGARMARTGITRAYGTRIRRYLSASAANRIVAAISGLISAMILQSSMAVALFLASFTRMGRLGTQSGLAIMLGADVGSAIVASFLSLDIKQAWPFLIAGGYVIHTIYDSRNNRGKQIGRVMLGLGLVLLSLQTLGVAAQSLSSSELLQDILTTLGRQYILTIILLSLLTWLAHSSLAMLLLLSSMVAAGVITDPEIIITMILGINIGGGIPALVLTWTESPVVRRITLGNALFRLICAIIALGLIEQMTTIYLAMPMSPALSVVGFHLMFNLALLMVCLPVIGPATRLLSLMQPDNETGAAAFGPKFLTGNFGSEPPSLAISALLRETIRIIEIVEEMLMQCVAMLKTGDTMAVNSIHELDDRLDVLYEAVKAFATNLSREDSEIGESRRSIDIITYAANLENAGDLIEKNLLDTVSSKIQSGTDFSKEGQEEIDRLFDYVKETAQVAAATAIGWEADNAALLIDRKSRFKALAKESLDNHLHRLRLGKAPSVDTSSFHMDMLGDLQRVNSLLCGIGYSVKAEKQG